VPIFGFEQFTLRVCLFYNPNINSHVNNFSPPPVWKRCFRYFQKEKSIEYIYIYIWYHSGMLKPFCGHFLLEITQKKIIFYAKRFEETEGQGPVMRVKVVEDGNLTYLTPTRSLPNKNTHVSHPHTMQRRRRHNRCFNSYRQTLHHL
jgi:hypothetical protein